MMTFFTPPVTSSWLIIFVCVRINVPLEERAIKYQLHYSQTYWLRTDLSRRP